MKAIPRVLTLMVLVSGCASNGTPETVRYLLRADPVSAQRMAIETPRVGIGRVVVAPYLGQLGIVLETGPGQIRAARQHLWAEPFDQGLRHYLRQALSAEIGVDVSIDTSQRSSWDYLLDVQFEEFHGTEDGDVRMAVEYTWTAMATGPGGRRNMFADLEPLSDDGYEAMVTAHKTLLARLVRAMAEAVPERPSS
jgi:hypothetical protein